jgi:hypothetical protein
MIFEKQEDLQREKKAIETFVNRFGGSYKKLSPDDVDYRVYDKNKNLIAYVEVKSRLKKVKDAFPLPIAAKKVTKLCDKRLNPTIIWACEDGILYGKIQELNGEVRWGSRGQEYKDEELMIYFPKQKTLKYIWYYK